MAFQIISPYGHLISMLTTRRGRFLGSVKLQSWHPSSACDIRKVNSRFPPFRPTPANKVRIPLGKVAGLSFSRARGTTAKTFKLPPRKLNSLPVNFSCGRTCNAGFYLVCRDFTVLRDFSAKRDEKRFISATEKFFVDNFQHRE